MIRDRHSHVQTYLRPGFWVSPGFYMGYWKECILANFPLEIIKKHNGLTKYREMWVGAILAASDTKDSGTHHFVGLPGREPPDVDIIHYENTLTSTGKKGLKRKHTSVEITRCDLDSGETLLDQVLNKNKPAYTGMNLAVYVYGSPSQTDYQYVLNALKKEEQVYPTEIVCLEFVMNAGPILLLPGSYGISRLWPKPGSKLVNLSDANAFFRRPNDVVTDAIPRLRTGRDYQDLGTFELLTPKIKL